MSAHDFVYNLPARLTVEETAKQLGFAPHDIPVIVGAGLLNPLGAPAPNAPKFFATIVIQQLASDARWLDKATRAVGKYWQKKRERQRIQ